MYKRQPYDEWLRSGLGVATDAAYARPGGPGEVIDRTAVARLVDEHRRGRFDHKRVLYCLLEFAHWHAAFVEA